MQWIKGTPDKDGWYFVWLPVSPHFGCHKAHPQVALWGEDEWCGSSALVDGAPVSHYAVIEPPEGE